jgi:hypothetical protein
MGFRMRVVPQTLVHCKCSTEKDEAGDIVPAGFKSFLVPGPPFAHGERDRRLLGFTQRMVPVAPCVGSVAQGGRPGTIGLWASRRMWSPALIPTARGKDTRELGITRQVVPHSVHRKDSIWGEGPGTMGPWASRAVWSPALTPLHGERDNRALGFTRNLVPHHVHEKHNTERARGRGDTFLGLHAADGPRLFPQAWGEG